MAEAKNTFIKSKMNKDLDARLLPSGEYKMINLRYAGTLAYGAGGTLLVGYGVAELGKLIASI